MGLLVLPFALAIMVSAANINKFSTRFGRKTILTGIGGMFAGQAVMLLVLHVSGPHPDGWALVGPLFLRVRVTGW
jgi:hypothetical protein